MSGRSREWAWALLAGALFGLGLAISGMSDPVVVRGFLDVTGAWNPQLAFVMGGALLAAAPAFALARRRGRDAGGQPLSLPSTGRIDAPLVLGALLFGVGWGLAGICPGPGLVTAALGYGEAIIFTLAMLAGMGVFALVNARRTPRA